MAVPEMDPLLEFFVNFQMPPLLFAALIGIPSCLLYLGQVLIVLGHWGEFNSSFFKLFIVRALPSIWNMVSSYFSFRLPLLFPVQMLPIYVHIPRLLLITFFFTSYYTYHVENLSTFFLVLNRLTAILVPFRHHSIWKAGVPLAIGLIILLPLALTYSAFGLKGEIIFLDNANISFSFLTMQDEFPFSRGASASFVLFTLLCFILNVATIFAYRRHKQKLLLTMTMNRRQSQSAVVNEDKMQSKLTKYAAITFLCQLSMGFCMTSMYVSQWIASPRSYQVGYAIFNFYAPINDICTLAIPAWTMLWASTKMRIIFKRKLLAMKRLLLPCHCQNMVADQPSPIAAATGTKLAQTVVATGAERFLMINVGTGSGVISEYKLRT